MPWHLLASGAGAENTAPPSHSSASAEDSPPAGRPAVGAVDCRRPSVSAAAAAPTTLSRHGASRPRADVTPRVLMALGAAGRLRFTCGRWLDEDAGLRAACRPGPAFIPVRPRPDTPRCAVARPASGAAQIASTVGGRAGRRAAGPRRRAAREPERLAPCGPPALSRLRASRLGLLGVGRPTSRRPSCLLHSSPGGGAACARARSSPRGTSRLRRAPLPPTLPWVAVACLGTRCALRGERTACCSETSAARTLPCWWTAPI